MTTCLDGELYTFGSTDYTFCPHAVTRSEAKSICDDAGLSLLDIGDEDENDWLLATAEAQPTSGATSDSSLRWLGLNDIDSEGSWVWDDGSEPTYTNRSPGWDSEGAERDCAALVVETPNPEDTPDGTWHPMLCDDVSLAFVCKAP